MLQALVEERRTGKDVELMSFYGLDYPVAHGRGVGETRLIQTALRSSRVMGALGDDELFWKITGRLQVRNFQRLVASAPARATLYADFRRLPRPWIDTRVFACTPAGFRAHFWPRVEGMRQDELAQAGYSAPEEWLFGELLPGRETNDIVPRLRVEPIIRGYSGHGHDLARPSRRLWSAARGLSRLVLPRLWI